MATQIFKYVSKFLDKVIVPDATEDNEAVNKGQLDSFISGNTLQQVTDNGNTTDNDIIISQVDESGDYTSRRKANSILITNHSSTETYQLTYPDGFTAVFATAVNGTMANSSGNILIGVEQIMDILETIPSYNSSTTQVLGHDASGNIQWVAP